MKLSKAGLDLIKKYEGLRLTAYKPVPTEKYWTIDYGHYGADVRAGTTITRADAEAYLLKDCASAVEAVNVLGCDFNQNQFDALVSFTYNCGAGNLRTLCRNRTIEEIGEKIVLYNKAGGKVLKGLVRRRTEEQALYKKGVVTSVPDTNEEYPRKEFIRDVQSACGAKVDGIAGSETLSKAVTISKKRNNRHEVVEAVQKYLNANGYPCGSADGIFGSKTEIAVKEYQADNSCIVDGEITTKNKTWKKLLGLA